VKKKRNAVCTKKPGKKSKPTVASTKPCPRCGEVMPVSFGLGVSLCRRDNKTYICADCGTDEAFFDYLGVRWKSIRPRILDTWRFKP